MILIVILILSILIGIESSKELDFKKPFSIFKLGFSKIMGTIFKGTLILSLFMLVLIELSRLIIYMIW